MKNEKFIPGKIVEFPEIAKSLLIKESEFEICTIIQGGMGQCIKIKSIGNQRYYCVKRIKPELLINRDSYVRFLDELEVWLSATECNGVVEALGVVRIDEIPSVLSPWMVGGDFRHAKNSLEPTKIFSILIRVVRTLGWVHDQLGVVHRDIKPANILLDEENKGYVTDWGLARPIKNFIDQILKNPVSSKFQRPERTGYGNWLGTPPYLSPEQILNASEVDHRADIYSLGCIMYELETGLPPFIEGTGHDILMQHLNNQPKPVKKFLTATKFGLEKVIERCLQKSTRARYQTYSELENDLLNIAKAKNFSLENIDIDNRSKKYRIGHGVQALSEIIKNAPIKNDKAALVEEKKIKPFLEEAVNLISLNRFYDAEKILGRFYVPEIFTEINDWYFDHSIAVNYAYCLQKMEGRLLDAIKIYELLCGITNKPAEYFINYSLALIQTSQWGKAFEICSAGLVQFPDDLDLLGNLSIALLYEGEIDAAYQNALHRLEKRRDVHSLEEIIESMSTIRNQIRIKNLPDAIAIAEKQYQLIKEGLLLNPHYAYFHIAKIQLMIFVESIEDYTNAYKTMVEDEWVHTTFKQVALSYTIKALSIHHPKEALEILEKHYDRLSFAPVKDDLLKIKMEIYANHYMIGKNDKNGERILIKQVIEYFLEKTNNQFRDGFMAARILEWMGNFGEAEKIIQELLEVKKDDWDILREYSFMLTRANRIDDARVFAEKVLSIGPWKAESYDPLWYIAYMMNDKEEAKTIRQKSDDLLKREMDLFDSLRNKINIQ